MKTIKTLTYAVLMLLSFSAFAAGSDSKLSPEHPKYVVANAPLVWGDSLELPPIELEFVKAKYAKVPLAPFVWGSPEDYTDISASQSLSVPVAPFIFGNPDEQVPEIVETN